VTECGALNRDQMVAKRCVLDFGHEGDHESEDGTKWPRRNDLTDSDADLLDAIRMAYELVESFPPRPWVVRASHSVPYGRVYRQWDTRGRLIVWANRGEIADLKHGTPSKDNFALTSLLAIPVVFE
jgi:hypothetical protein